MEHQGHTYNPVCKPTASEHNFNLEAVCRYGVLHCPWSFQQASE